MTDTPAIPTIDMDGFMARYAAYESRANALLPANKTVLFDALQAADITSVTVTFDGCGDSGQIDAIVARAGDGEITLPDTQVELARTDFHLDETRRESMALPDAVETFCYDALESRHGGWENNEGGFGDFTFDVAARTIAFDFNYRIEKSENHYHEL